MIYKENFIVVFMNEVLKIKGIIKFKGAFSTGTCLKGLDWQKGNCFLITISLPSILFSSSNFGVQQENNGDFILSFINNEKDSRFHSILIIENFLITISLQ